MIYITHRMSEVYEICDRITLLRDGKIVFTDLIEMWITTVFWPESWARRM